MEEMKMPKSKHEIMSDRDCIRLIARREGLHHQPKYYKDQVKQQFNRDVSNASVTKSIGTYANRLSLNQELLIAKAKELVAACRFDYAYSQHILVKAMYS